MKCLPSHRSILNISLSINEYIPIFFYLNSVSGIFQSIIGLVLCCLKIKPIYFAKLQGKYGAFISCTCNMLAYMKQVERDLDIAKYRLLVSMNTVEHLPVPIFALVPTRGPPSR